MGLVVFAAVAVCHIGGWFGFRMWLKLERWPVWTIRGAIILLGRRTALSIRPAFGTV